MEILRKERKNFVLFLELIKAGKIKKNNKNNKYNVYEEKNMLIGFQASVRMRIQIKSYAPASVSFPRTPQQKQTCLLL